MIISASRRTDIPAFHSEWMMARLRAGSCMVRNPVARNVVHRIDLTRRNVDCIEFITKDPRPMVPYIREIMAMGHMFVFQVTLTPYGRGIEPGVGPKADISDACAEIAGRIGRDRVTWRYDPVLMPPGTDIRYHIRKFETFCNEAAEWTDRCIFSFVDTYGRTPVGYRAPTVPEQDEFCRAAVRIARDHGISLDACCTERDLSVFGVGRRGCFDPGIMRSLDIPYESQSTPYRKGCRCVKAIDIGEYGTCPNGCVYCYASHPVLPDGVTRLYSPESELLWGAVMPRDTVVDMRGREASRIDGYRRATLLREEPTATGMDLLSVVLIAVGLAMDAFAVSVCKGMAMQHPTVRQMVVVGLWFGGFQVIMPVIGFYLGDAMYGLISSYDHWIAFILLALIGANMIREGLSGEQETADASLAFRTMLLLAIATSIDALAVGISFAMTEGEIWVPAAIIGVITFLISAFGVKVGSVFGDRFGSKAEILGGAILIVIGFRILFEHLGYI